MILHTIISEYDIFKGTDDAPMPQFTNIAGGIEEYRVNSDGKREMVRLHSTNPYLYLKGEYSPFFEIK